jgi:hypothetical protein
VGRRNGNSDLGPSDGYPTMTQETPASLSVVFQVIDILEELGVRYHLGGSFASAIHGVPRQTMDADLVVDVDAVAVSRLVDSLHGDFYADLAVAKEAVALRGAFNTIHLKTGFKVDFFVVGTGEFDQVELERSEFKQIIADPPRSAWVKTAEDTVLRKLQWYRSGGEVSDRQWCDVLGVLMAARERLDRDHLHRWAAELGVGDLLDRAIREVESS